MTRRRAITSDQAPPALGPYSQAISAGGFVFCSGLSASTRRPVLPATASLRRQSRP